MANPQKDNGYTAIANQIMDALCKIRIPGEARQVFDFVLRKTYGWNKTSDCIPLSQFTEATGMTKSSVCKAIKKLKEMNLIEVSSANQEFANRYSINKDFETWNRIKKVTRGVSKKGNECPVDNPVDNSLPKKEIVSFKGNIHCQKRKYSFPLKDTSKDNYKRQLQKTTLAQVLESSDARSLVAYFCQCYKNKFRADYIPEWGKDAKLLKGLAEITGRYELIKLIDLYFEVDDNFIANSGHTIGIFKTQINKLLQIKRGNIVPAKKAKTNADLRKIELMISDRLGQIAKKESIADVMREIPQNLWWLVDRFLKKQYPQDRSGNFGQVEAQLIREKVLSKESVK